MKIKKYSTIQRYSYFPNEYRVKNYITKKWEYIKRLNGIWIFKDIKFPNATILRQYLNIENKI